MQPRTPLPTLAAPGFLTESQGRSGLKNTQVLKLSSSRLEVEWDNPSLLYNTSQTFRIHDTSPKKCSKTFFYPPQVENPL